MGDFNLRKWREFILSEDTSNQEKMVVDIKDITLDMLKELFPTRYKDFTLRNDEEPFYRDFVNLPLGSGKAQSIFGEKALEQWKNKVTSYGHDQITIDPSRAWNNFPIQLVYSPEQLEREREIGQGQADYYSSKKPGEFQGD